MNYINLILFFLIGAFIGSICTTIGLRLPNDDEKLFKKSHCDICYHKLTLLEIIPVISFIFLKGRCRYCHKKIDIKNIVMELITGILFVLSYYNFGLSYELLIALGIISLLMIVTVSDITYMVIPDEVLIFFSGYFIIVQYLSSGIQITLEHLFSGFFLFCIMYSIMLIGNKVFKKESLGGGDVKMMFLFGLILDPLLGTLTIFIGSILALPISLCLLYKNEEKLIPFGPFLLLAFTFIYFIKITPSTIISLLTL